jgi:hypothetical protein
MRYQRIVLVLLLIAISARTAFAASGTEGASFLDIPVGGAPAALGSAYTAQATDVYAPVWNPAGLGFLHSIELTGTHLDYISPVYYEHAGFVVPLGNKNDETTSPAGLGVSMQYLGTNSIDARDAGGNPQGTFTAAFAAYSLAYGEKLNEKLSLGLNAKLITETISDASAKAYATDLGALYKPTTRLSIGAVVANLGSGLKFVDESDPLPLAGRLGATYQLRPQWDLSVETVYRETGLFSGSLGVEWRYGDVFSFRTGYNSSRVNGLGAGAGFSAGLGLFFWGQEFSYAWVPMGDLGQSHYFSLVFRWDTKPRPEHPRLKRSEDREFEEFEDPSKYHDIYDFLNDDERKTVK